MGFDFNDIFPSGDYNLDGKIDLDDDCTYYTFLGSSASLTTEHSDNFLDNYSNLDCEYDDYYDDCEDDNFFDE